jgi:putative membrane protein
LNRTLRLFGLVLGLAVLAWLILHVNIAELGSSVARVGWGFLAVVAARAATVVIDAGAWYCLFPKSDRPAFGRLLPLRWIAESINTTLPAAQVGGEIVRARLVQRFLAYPLRGAASVAVDFTFSLFAQIVFTLLGFVLLARLGDPAGRWWAVSSAALVPVFAAASWEVLARRRVLVGAERLAQRLGRHRAAAWLHRLGEALALIARGPSPLLRSLSLHAASFLAHGGELWLTLYLMQVQTGLAAAMMLESLSLAARSFAFLIPSGWGAQEAVLLALAGVAGLSPETALALGLVKRAREFAVGLPGLVAWGVAEHWGRKQAA